MRLRMVTVGLIIIVLAVVAVSCGRTETPAKSAAPVPDVKARNLQVQVDRLQSLVGRMSPAVDPEPKRDVSNGSYVALVDHVATESSAPVLVLDFVTLGSPPHSDAHLWNKTRYVQSVRVAADAALDVPIESSPDAMVSGDELGSRWSAQPWLTGTPFYVSLSDGQVTAMWPVPLP